MAYWLFQVIDRYFPQIWFESLSRGIAIHNYSDEDGPYTTHSKAAIGRLAKITRGDMLVASFLGHRFAGYARVTTDLFQDGKPLNLKSVSGGIGPCYERHKCEWVALPPKVMPYYVEASELKKRGHDIDFTIGMPAKEISKETFRALKQLLDSRGAIPRGGLAKK